MTGQNDGNSGDEQRSNSKREHGHAEERPLRPKCVDEPACRRLGEDPCDAADGKSEPNALFVPLVAGEVDREERPDPRLDVGEQKIQRIEATQRSP